jgi:hypothetical protein
MAVTYRLNPADFAECRFAGSVSVVDTVRKGIFARVYVPYGRAVEAFRVDASSRRGVVSEKECRSALVDDTPAVAVAIEADAQERAFGNGFEPGRSGNRAQFDRTGGKIQNERVRIVVGRHAPFGRSAH